MSEIKKSKLQFDNPKIIDLIFKDNPNFDINKYKGMGIKFESQVDKHQTTLADVNLTVKIGTDEETVPFTMQITASACFKWEDNLDEAQIDSMLNYNARIMLLSYLRPFISHLTVDAGYPPFILPFYDFSDNE